MTDFVHLHVHSPYSFLASGTSLWRLVQRAKELEFSALALTDHNTLAGAARFQELMREVGLKPIFGAEVTLADGYHLVLLAKDNDGYRNLSRLLTVAHLSQSRGAPLVTWANLQQYATGLIVLSGCRRGEIPYQLLRGNCCAAQETALKLLELFGPDFYLEVQADLLPGQARLLAGLKKLQTNLNVPIVATNNVHYAMKEDFAIFDVLTCVHHRLKLTDVAEARRLNAENYLKTAAEIAAVFPENPEFLGRSLEIAAKCNVRLGGRSFFPVYPLPSPQARWEFLRDLTWEGAKERYGEITAAIRNRLEHELNVIGQLNFADYFLVVWDALQFARRQGIRFAGRGSAADSAVAYCLKITEVDAIGRGLLFERFLSLERAEQPDIDVDFDSRYRDRVADYFRNRYGREKVAAVGTFQTFRARLAIREVGKVLGLPEEEIDDLAKRMPWIDADDFSAAMEFFPELRSLPQEKHIAYRELLGICARIAGFPKFLGTHLGGIVVSDVPVADIVPIQWSGKGEEVIQADKRDIEELGLFKIDLLSLRTLAVIEDSIREIRAANPSFRETETLQDHPEVYARLQRGETIGVFQLESPAQRALQTRLHAERFEDIVASVALIRPGPIKGEMVEPYIARRQGLAPVEYLHPALVDILGKTYGVVLFQEQAIEIVRRVAGFSAGEADRLRRTMSHSRSREEMEAIGKIFQTKAVERGVKPEIAKEIFSYLVGYAGYGFCEAHAAAFATTALKTAYLVEHYPAEFFAALFNHQPMGFYPPNTLALEAKRRGIHLLPLDIQTSEWDFQATNKTIRVGFRQLKEMNQETAANILAARQEKQFGSWQDFAIRTEVNSLLLRNLVLAGAFDSLYPNRRALLWEIKQGECQGLFVGLSGVSLKNYPDFTLREKTEWEYRLLRLNTTHRLMEIWRREYGWDQGNYATTETVRQLAGGTRVSIIGLLLRPHRPPTKSGQVVVFFTLEDEFGFLDATLFERDYQKCGEWIFGQRSGPRLVSGVLQRRGDGLALIAESVKLPPNLAKTVHEGALATML